MHPYSDDLECIGNNMKNYSFHFIYRRRHHHHRRYSTEGGMFWCVVWIFHQLQNNHGG